MSKTTVQSEGANDTGAAPTRYDRAVASIKAVERRAEAGGYALMASIDGYGRGANGSGTFGKISHIAKLFCIGFAFLVPSLLVWRVLL